MKAIVYHLWNKTVYLFGLFIVLFAMPQIGYGQVSNYAFTEFIGTYNSIYGSMDPDWCGTMSQFSNAKIENIPLPFNFCLGGTSGSQSFDRISISGHGYIVFSNSITNSVAPLSGGQNNNVVSAFGHRLRTSSACFGTRMSGVSVGTSPNRVIVIEWGQPSESDRFYRHDETGDRLYFQIKLYETTNVIEIVYGPITSSSTTLGNIEVGLRGNNASDFNVRSMSTNTSWLNNNTAGTAINQRMRFRNTSLPQNGLTFRWTPVGGPSADPADHSGCYFSPLPVELTAFNAEAKDKTNRIYWTTATEQNSDYFDVERSLNGGEWDLVGRVQSAGNSSTTLHYEIEDRGFEPTINYYRLKQVDFDGTTKYYNIISVDNRTSKSELLKTVNTMGQEVNQYYKGMVIEIYSDGSTQKYYRQ